MCANTKSRQLCKSKDNIVAKPSWAEALKDAELRLREAKQKVSEWQLVVEVCRSRVQTEADWPNAGQSSRHSEKQQHSV